MFTNHQGWKLTGLCDFLGKGNLLNVKYQQLYFGATFRKIKGFESWDRNVFLQKWLILADVFFFSLDVLGN